MVAVQSGSMEPNMERTDLILVMDTERVAGGGAHAETGIVPAETAEQTAYTRFGEPGDVVIYYPNGERSDGQIIHRAMFWVESGENWVDSGRANEEYMRGSTCAQVQNCPAPHAGFITKGDANPVYDQAAGISEPVQGEWIRAKGQVRVPYLGWVRLAATGE